MYIAVCIFFPSPPNYRFCTRSGGYPFVCVRTFRELKGWCFPAYTLKILCSEMASDVSYLIFLTGRAASAYADTSSLALGRGGVPARAPAWALQSWHNGAQKRGQLRARLLSQGSVQVCPGAFRHSTVWTIVILGVNPACKVNTALGKVVVGGQSTHSLQLPFGLE